MIFKFFRAGDGDGDGYGAGAGDGAGDGDGIDDFLGEMILTHHRVTSLRCERLISKRRKDTDNEYSQIG